MIEIFECTDCKHCANFNDGDRVICMHPTMPPDEVCKYHPVDEWDASTCEGFEEPWDVYKNKIGDFSTADFRNAEKFSAALYNGDINYAGIRKWVERYLLTKIKNGV